MDGGEVMLGGWVVILADVTRSRDAEVADGAGAE